MMEWISVKERMPEFGTDVLTYSSYDRIRQTKLAKSKSWILGRPNGSTRQTWFEYSHGGRFHNHDGVTHWMPLPEPPQS